MINTAKTYVAFDGQGVLSHQLNKAYDAYMALKQGENTLRFITDHEISFEDITDITSDVLKRRLEVRMKEADNLLVLASEDSDIDNPLLNWEIETAIHVYHLPVIVAYVDAPALSNSTIQMVHNWLPKPLQALIKSNTIRVAHLGWNMRRLLEACNKYSRSKDIFPAFSRYIY